MEDKDVTMKPEGQYAIDRTIKTKTEIMGDHFDPTGKITGKPVEAITTEQPKAKVLDALNTSREASNLEYAEAIKQKVEKAVTENPDIPYDQIKFRMPNRPPESVVEGVVSQTPVPAQESQVSQVPSSEKPKLKLGFLERLASMLQPHS